ncbi:MAG: hypothetical protein JWO37_1, partial [Acidimicrobiales bacterium]|nr:hypothetical protein [Acidimicrobiales bacterium]
MGDRLAELRDAVVAFAAAFEPDALAPADAGAAVRDAALIEHAA